MSTGAVSAVTQTQAARENTVAELNQKGMDLLLKMVGKKRAVDPVNAAVAAGHPSLPMVKTLVNDCYGEVWQRPGLSLHQRSLITVAMMLAVNRRDELENHIRGALANGVTEQELWELANHAIWYLGLPTIATWSEAMTKATADDPAPSNSGGRS